MFTGEEKVELSALGFGFTSDRVLNPPIVECSCVVSKTPLGNSGLVPTLILENTLVTLQSL